jgi:hypothetical protein
MPGAAPSPQPPGGGHSHNYLAGDHSHKRPPCRQCVSVLVIDNVGADDRLKPFPYAAGL